MESNNSSKIDDLSRKKVHERLSRIQFGKIEIVEDENTLSFGEDNSSFEGKIIINDYKFYSELVFGGSIGAAEAFMMKYWDTDDLTIIIRILLQNRSILDEFDSGFGSIMKPLRKLAHWLQRNTRKGSQKNISAHYDLGNDFFETWLDSKMMYSCAIYKNKDSSLEEASTLKIDRICKKLNLKESDHLLEIGTGWGGFAIYAAKNYGCKVTSTTISKEQHQMAKSRVDEEGLSSRINLLLEDYRDLSGQFDKLVSIEMIEAVGYQYYSDYFKKCSSLLKADGLMVLQAITIADQQYKKSIKSVDFIQKYIFPGGCLPSVSCMTEIMTTHTDLRVTNIEDIGLHYAFTLKEWRDRLYESIEKIKKMGYSDTFIRMWHYYLCYCEGAFIERAIGDVQMILMKPENRNRPYLNFEK
jgi:cyclopropane-fatty-acyl-phospholipid synthase